MRTYPIILSGPMVRALLEGRKTQTRRLITSMWSNVKMHHEVGEEEVLLYVREAWANCGDYIRYAATDDIHELRKRRPSIHMPRWASRLTLEVTDVRLQRLQDISDEDAIAEGFKSITKDGNLIKYGIPDRDSFPGTDNDGWPWAEWSTDPRQAYARLWESLHGKGSWKANPEIVALSFMIHHCNVDRFISEKAA
jgi:hypothetical protein